jgi:phosphatidylethanolamine-binding protein
MEFKRKNSICFFSPIRKMFKLLKQNKDSKFLRTFYRGIGENPSVKLDQDSTPNLFSHSYEHKKKLISVIEITKIFEREKKLPPVPTVDFRKLTNEFWGSKGYQRNKQTYTAFKELELDRGIYSMKELETVGLQEEIFENLKINLNVSYGKEGENFYFDNALLGNFLEASMVHNEPKVNFPKDGLEENDLYTLVMFTPDYPFRLVPDEGVFVHWIISNVPINKIKEGKVVCDYLSPLPTENAGTFRYVFQLFKQNEKLTKEFKINKFEERKNFNLQNFLSENNIEPFAKGMSFFRTEYDHCVTEKYHELKVEEPIYTPPDFEDKESKVKSSKKLIKLESNRW